MFALWQHSHMAVCFHFTLKQEISFGWVSAPALWWVVMRIGDRQFSSKIFLRIWSVDADYSIFFFFWGRLLYLCLLYFLTLRVYVVTSITQIFRHLSTYCLFVCLFTDWAVCGLSDTRHRQQQDIPQRVSGFPGHQPRCQGTYHQGQPKVTGSLSDRLRNDDDVDKDHPV